MKPYSRSLLMLAWLAMLAGLAMLTGMAKNVGAAGLSPTVHVQYHPQKLWDGSPWDGKTRAGLVTKMDADEVFVSVQSINPDPASKDPVTGERPTVLTTCVPHAMILLVAVLADHYAIDLDEALGVVMPVMEAEPWMYPTDEEHGDKENSIYSVTQMPNTCPP